MIPVVLATLAYGLALTLLVSRPWLRTHPKRMALALAAICALLHLPVLGISLLVVLRGVLGDLSIVTLVFLTSLFFQGPRPLLPSPRIFTLMGFAFFLLSFGLSPLHPYAWGYASAILPCLAGGLAFLLWLRGRYAFSLALLAALLGWRLHWLDSTNLWDYLLDAPLVVVALVHAVFCALPKSPFRRGKMTHPD
ncbi:MAG: hypothetical protein LBD68_11650 [Zoogloeaceae bacterium]|nr:hypothetical protein [Zoogloeaceae bacterium]